MNNAHLQQLSRSLKGELFYDKTVRTLYATDASAYRELPLAVAIPETNEDLRKLIAFANEHGTSLIPRTAGTSLAGQVVGKGIVVDVSRKFNQVLEVNQEERWVKVQPGVIRDELNMHLAPYGLYFGPETSTANRAMIGGMVGNNSCGSNSVVYGSARDHLVEVTGFLSDGSEVTFSELTAEEFLQKCEGTALENELYRQIREMLSDGQAQQEIEAEYPKPSIPRRNTGYAIDLLARMEPFKEGGKPFNFCELIAGSEGTLMFITEIKMSCDPLPPKYKGLVCGHFNTIDESLRANLIGLKYNPSASELMDHFILECTKANISQRENRFFVEGDPGAILVVELSRDSQEELHRDAQALIEEMKAAGLGYHYPIVEGEDIKKVWTLRKAGLGLLSNIPGDAKPAPVIEDTAVDVQDLPAYIAEFNKTLEQYNMSCVHYAHAGSGELHLRPILDLKTEEGNKMFHTVADEIAKLVKKYKGSLSGEHGDGRLRGEFIRFMVGENNYERLKELKYTWDPKGVFNPNKIVDTPPMNTSMRYMPGIETPEVDTVFDFTDTQGYIRAAEFCNGSGDCRKTEKSGGTMCPSYMATRDEKHTTRARANVLREFLREPYEINRFNHDEIYEVMDLCLSCKACKSECPSNVDMAKLKAEFLQHYYDANGVPARAKLIANFSTMNKLASMVPWAYNAFVKFPPTAYLFNKLSGFATERSTPTLHSTTLKKWFNKHQSIVNSKAKGQVYFFADEFTDYNDTPIGIKAVELLERLGYEVILPKHIESGRTYLSKGLVREAKEIAIRNVNLLKDIVSEDIPMVGIEPSTILTFRDEYIDLVPGYLKEEAKILGKNAMLVEEFLLKEMKKGNISSDQFTKEQKLIKLHGHCHQKALSSVGPTKQLLSLPENYEVHMIPSGCCGMAGSFGYEQEHYETSMQVGELVLFPTVRQQPEEVAIAAPGTSCRHQIMDGTGRKAQHPVELLLEALVDHEQVAVKKEEKAVSSEQ
ncbi:FAD-binding and (Fe-S)-binding domain-containing protein [Algivirga pacifica]|uniref:FAD-binding and (Fe-S)-binding domain-containing protein n=1 Tax=Algivirga pacifica TaxID=1162670 RepID=A0ABP9DBW0_9BACT